MLPFELHLPGHNFTGPGTDLACRIDPRTLAFRPGRAPVNRVDLAAFRHDVGYASPRDRHEVDLALIEELEGILSGDLSSWREYLEAGFVLLLLTIQCSLRTY